MLFRSNRINPVMEGNSRFTESVKSFIQAVVLEIVVPAALSITVLVLEAGDLSMYVSHGNNCVKLVKWDGKKGTARSPSRTNQRLYCIRPDR